MTTICVQKVCRDHEERP